MAHEKEHAIVHVVGQRRRKNDKEWKERLGEANVLGLSVFRLLGDRQIRQIVYVV
jgi:predicted SprT family Zn-dependent metalloprotease